jgi:hypothetical protein
MKFVGLGIGRQIDRPAPLKFKNRRIVSYVRI